MKICPVMSGPHTLIVRGNAVQRHHHPATHKQPCLGSQCAWWVPRGTRGYCARALPYSDMVLENAVAFDDPAAKEGA